MMQNYNLFLAGDVIVKFLEEFPDFISPWFKRVYT